MSDSVAINKRLASLSSIVMTSEKKEELYKQVHSIIQMEARIIQNPVSMMATVSALLKNTFPHYFWTGFYLLNPEDPQELIIGPYQGTYACTKITLSRGVCGRCARCKKTIVVSNVNDCEYHIACDSKSQSEIVVPVMRDGELYAVLDIDSEQLSAFDEIDKTYLELIIKDAFDA